LADTHPRLCVDPRCEQQRGVERLDREALQRVGFQLEVVADRQCPTGDPAGIVGGVAASDELVQLGDRVDVRDRDQVAAAEPADLTLDAALLMGAFETGLTEERVEPVMRSQSDEPNRSDSARSRPFNTRTTAGFKLS
jgi:hypothetical protein